MPTIPLHVNTWNLSPHQAVELQYKLAHCIIRENHVAGIQYIAGIDVAFKLNEKTDMAHAAVVLMTYPELKLVEKHTYQEPVHMPYIPGLLSFRELPSMLGAFAKLNQQPDLVIVDGMGVAHPRRIGIASHLGLCLNIPTIGCGKSLLVGTYNKGLLGENKGSWVPLIDKKEVIGAVVRTRKQVSPVFISVGHLIDLEASIRYVVSCCRGYRLPEPIRQADKLSKA